MQKVSVEKTSRTENREQAENDIKRDIKAVATPHTTLKLATKPNKTISPQDTNKHTTNHRNLLGKKNEFPKWQPPRHPQT